MSSYMESCQSDRSIDRSKEVFEQEVEYVTRALRGCNDVLSVGCGPAIIEKALQEKNFNVTGLDVSEEALEGAPDSIRAVVGSAENMDKFVDSSFDAAIYVASLQFINDYEKALQETARVLRSKGKLLVMLLNPESHFFQEKTSQPDSYVNKIKHPYLKQIEKAIHKYFGFIERTYYLGIKGNQIFDSQHPKTASLYIIQGIRRQARSTHHD